MSFYSIGDFIRENYPEYWGLQSILLISASEFIRLMRNGASSATFGTPQSSLKVSLSIPASASFS